MSRERASSARDTTTVGALLQYWRGARRKSQLALAHDAGVSPRHVCFIETGRAKPSREMLLLLAGVLDVPLRERNALLLAGGFAPVYREAGLDAPELGPARRAFEAILRQQEPYPAVVWTGTGTCSWPTAPRSASSPFCSATRCAPRPRTWSA